MLSSLWLSPYSTWHNSYLSKQTGMWRYVWFFCFNIIDYDNSRIILNTGRHHFPCRSNSFCIFFDTVNHLIPKYFNAVQINIQRQPWLHFYQFNKTHIKLLFRAAIFRARWEFEVKISMCFGEIRLFLNFISSFRTSRGRISFRMPPKYNPQCRAFRPSGNTEEANTANYGNIAC